jgi:hypothetical protein
MSKLYSKIPALLLVLLAGLVCSSPAFGNANIVIQNNDAAGVGFRDTTPATPIGGNTGTTVGEQRLIAFQRAADIWGATITSGPTIVIDAAWEAQPCTSNSASLGAATARSFVHDFTGAPVPGTWYPVALANALTGNDLNGASAEIRARFNKNIGTTGCLDNSHWYYGLDANEGSSGVNLVGVLLHEFGHGLGFLSTTDESTGLLFSGFPSVYDRFLLDNTTGKTWVQMTDAERKASAINNGNLVWNGAQVQAEAGFLTGGKDAGGHPRVYAPNPIKQGSSISHWDTVLAPNQIMEPNINHGLQNSVTLPQDLTFSLFKDIGWCNGCPTPTPAPTPTPPANDNFASAQTISGCTGTGVTGTNAGASHEPGEPSHDPLGDPGGGSVWYQWQAPSTGLVTFSTAGSDYDTLLAIYTGSSVSALTSQGKNDDVSSSDHTSVVAFNATAGTLYRIAVDGWGGDRGTIKLNWTASGCVSTPPVLLTEQNTTRAVALDSVNWMRDPVPVVGLFNFSADQRTRLALFVYNLGLPAGSPTSSVTVKINGGALTLPVESIGTLSGVTNVSTVVVRLVDQLPAGNVNVSVVAHGAESNVATLTIVK